jgi:DNA-binding response OmpR family regulator
MATILVVEDEAGLRELYSSELSEIGHKILLAADVPSAVALLKSESVDLVILDIRMPGMDGLAAIDEIMALERRVPVVINSAYSIYKDNFKSWSADAYVVKSSDLSELKATVEELLSRSSDGDGEG